MTTELNTESDDCVKLQRQFRISGALKEVLKEQGFSGSGKKLGGYDITVNQKKIKIQTKIRDESRLDFDKLMSIYDEMEGAFINLVETAERRHNFFHDDNLVVQPHSVQEKLEDDE